MGEKLERQQAESCARSVLARYSLDSPPICPFEIAKSEEILVFAKQSSSPGISGFLMRVGETFGIQYATHVVNEGFIRFTVAHELGHYFLPGHAEALFPSGDGIHESHSGFLGGDNNLENQADWFASELLMPTPLFLNKMRKCQPGFGAIETLAESFGVSITAAAIRYARFAEHPVCVVMSEGTRLSYCFMSDSVRDIKGITWPKKGSLLPNGATRNFNQTPSLIEKGERQESASFLCDWIDGAPDVEMNEDIVGLGSYRKTLTVLFCDEQLVDEEDAESED